MHGKITKMDKVLVENICVRDDLRDMSTHKKTVLKKILEECL
jgi:hypothetical protein